MTRKEIGYEVDFNGCFNCTSHCKDKDGYSLIFRDGKRQRMHRYIYEFNFGKIPEGLVVRHKCDNPSCINPNHLEIGTYKDNNQDREKRGRSRDNRGSKSPVSKIAEEDVKKIRKDNRSNLEISKEYGFARSYHIKLIKEYKIWKHVE